MATRDPIAWVLNLDADLELEAAGRYAPKKSVRSAMAPHVETLRRTLLAPQDVLVELDAGLSQRLEGAARGLPGRAFCPTPRAIAALQRSGATPQAHPTLDVLRRVNSRAFAASLGRTLPGETFVTDFDVGRAQLERDPEVSTTWRVKRAFGMAGRGQRVVDPRAIGPADLAFVERAVAADGAQIEPNVAIEMELALHGFVHPDGSSRSGTVVRQRCDPRGAWLGSEPLDQTPRPGVDELRHLLTVEVVRVAVALHMAGYFGPFGVDAYTYRDRQGQIRCQPRSEINARYSMGFAAGFRSVG